MWRVMYPHQTRQSCMIVIGAYPPTGLGRVRTGKGLPGPWRSAKRGGWPAPGVWEGRVSGTTPPTGLRALVEAVAGGALGKGRTWCGSVRWAEPSPGCGASRWAGVGARSLVDCKDTATPFSVAGGRRWWELKGRWPTGRTRNGDGPASLSSGWARLWTGLLLHFATKLDVCSHRWDTSMSLLSSGRALLPVWWHMRVRVSFQLVSLAYHNSSSSTVIAARSCWKRRRRSSCRASNS